MYKKFLIPFGLILAIGCASQELINSTEIRKQFDDLVQQHKFADAQALLDQHKNDPEWCIRYNYGGPATGCMESGPAKNEIANWEQYLKKLQEIYFNQNSQKVERDAENLIMDKKITEAKALLEKEHPDQETINRVLQEIKKSEDCDSKMEKCETLDISRNEADSCINLASKCSCITWDSRQWCKDAEAVGKKVLENLYRLTYSPLVDTPIAQALADKQNSCRNNRKWGYFSDKNSKTSFHGGFDSLSDCDEARVKAGDTFTGLGSTNVCKLHNSGKTQSADVIALDFMAYGQFEDAHKQTVYFSSQENCEKTIVAAFKLDFPPYDLTIYPKGSPERNRVIGPCYKKNLVICTTGGQGKIEEVKFVK